MQKYFSWQGQLNPNTTSHQFWIHDSHPIHLYANEVMQQKIDYIHNNPVRAGFVDEPQHWKYSSSRDYFGVKGILDLKPID